MITDSQSVKAAASVPAALRGHAGHAGGKEIYGRKRHVMVNSLGLLLTVRVTRADLTDRQAAADLQDRIAAVRFRTEEGARDRSQVIQHGRILTLNRLIRR